MNIYTQRHTIIETWNMGQTLSLNRCSMRSILEEASELLLLITEKEECFEKFCVETSLYIAQTTYFSAKDKVRNFMARPRKMQQPWGEAFYGHMRRMKDWPTGHSVSKKNGKTTYIISRRIQRFKKIMCQRGGIHERSIFRKKIGGLLMRQKKSKPRNILVETERRSRSIFGGS